MTEQLWTEVDSYISGLFAPDDAALDGALKASVEAGLPAIQVAPNQGKFLQLLARAIGARRILEIGSLGGYSTIWLARALPADGRLITLEADPKHAAVATKNFATAGLSDKIELRLGFAKDTLAQLAAEAQDPFDFIFIDADKANIPAYFTAALSLSRPGALIIVDNVVRKGRVIEADSADPDIEGVRAFNELAARETRVSVTAIQTVGSKGYDGFAVLLVNA
ncbi:O-methyltransferase family 3 [Methylocella silvestris BL2]|uniref:O-methyltransferase family 3 n=1 Tax=Methylocella silvestris (strain DSM 15510 / CIP 108128 / LMG 27833 / NCIMB 13906 / BL2) TaxID=395965 RepID=B8EN39_METSB|nr:O-methyltransferase [Methylocella silvestris]ACK49174.1 O-methyltransferase family 3 [Methylocella silvestris BL2]